MVRRDLNILNEVIVSFRFSLIVEGEKDVVSFRKENSDKMNKL